MGNLANITKTDVLPEFQTFLLDKEKMETTMIYTHALRDMSHAPQSPLDLLLKKG